MSMKMELMTLLQAFFFYNIEWKISLYSFFRLLG